MDTQVFDGFNLSMFWYDSDYALREYVCEKPSDELIISIEQELGYKLPASFIKLMKTHNGGVPRNTCFPVSAATSWAENHIAITGIMGIGRDKTYSLCGRLGSQFMIENWGYPKIGVCICNCPSAGHDMVMLDYTDNICEEPRVVHVDQENDYKITPLAENFEIFIRGLVNENVYNTAAEDVKKDIEKIETGGFSTLLTRSISKSPKIDYGKILRAVCKELTLSKGHFSLHADEYSYLVYDILFLLHTANTKVKSKQEYLKVYPSFLVFGDGKFATGGYAPAFIEDWFNKRISAGKIVTHFFSGFTFSKSYKRQIKEKLAKYL